VVFTKYAGQYMECDEGQWMYIIVKKAFENLHNSAISLNF
jgi:hypothetical protein